MQSREGRRPYGLLHNAKVQLVGVRTVVGQESAARNRHAPPMTARQVSTTGLLSVRLFGITLSCWSRCVLVSVSSARLMRWPRLPPPPAPASTPASAASAAAPAAAPAAAAPAAATPAAATPAASPGLGRRRRSRHNDTGNADNAENLAETISPDNGDDCQPANADASQAMCFLNDFRAEFRPDTCLCHI
jgi:hypothetical protein